MTGMKSFSSSDDDTIHDEYKVERESYGKAGVYETNQ